MRVLYGDMWKLPADGLVVATNTTVLKSGNLIMGGGQALAAARLYPELPLVFGAHHKLSEVPFGWKAKDGKVIITVPTKRDPGKDSILELIESGCKLLPVVADQHKLKNVLLPMLGCGLGNLKEKEVLPVLTKHLDDRFALVFYKK